MRFVAAAHSLHSDGLTAAAEHVGVRLLDGRLLRRLDGRRNRHQQCPGLAEAVARERLALTSVAAERAAPAAAEIGDPHNRANEPIQRISPKTS
jgi:hypothetical protein